MKSFIEYDVYCNFFPNVSFAIKIFINRKKETPLYFENYIEIWYFNENSDSEEYRYPETISRSIQLQIVASQLMHFVDYIRIEEIYIETNFSMKEI